MKTWTNKQGKKIPLNKMDLSYIVNCFALCIRHNDTKKANMLLNEINKRMCNSNYYV